jgi:hypothetical protein
VRDRFAWRSPKASSIIPIHTCAPGDLLSTRDGHLADGTGLPAKHARQGPVAQIDYWQANGGVTYQDLDGREVVFVSWIYRPPTRSARMVQEACSALPQNCLHLPR